MICATCYCMLRGQRGRQWRGTFDLHFEHQPNWQAVQVSAEMGCYICRGIWHELQKFNKTNFQEGNWETPPPLCLPPENDIEPSQNVNVSFPKRGWEDFGPLCLPPLKELHTRQNISAYLSEITKRPGLYRLDFRLTDRSRRLGTFLLEQTSNESESEVYTPRSKTMDSDEVLQLARFWIRKCLSQEHEHCPDENFTKFYHKRLVHLPSQNSYKIERKITRRDSTQEQENHPFENLTQEDKFYPTRLIELPPYDPTTTEKPIVKLDEVRLVTTKNQPNNFRGNPGRLHYVTLSHCWGMEEFIHLCKNNKKEFHERISLKSLPLTFRNAIEFARRLSETVRYIWIDSLCIVQDDPNDWLRESIQMYQIYRNSYCNISATAATDSKKGLYNKIDRDPQLLWEEQINLNIDGIPGARPKQKLTQEIGLEVPIRRCKILDLSFWDREVEDAPVNRRAWVLQERLLAPRVLHFCQDQVAWECYHLDATECFPHGVSNMELRSGHVKERARLKSLMPNDYGPKPVEVDKMEVSDSAHESWKRVIERYSKTGLTKESDKLIALAGIAELLSCDIRGLYVAGMWEKYLASQLLWRVDPIYENGQLSNPSQRPSSYRAPSFSWAAVDAPQGIRCGTSLLVKSIKFCQNLIRIL